MNSLEQLVLKYPDKPWNWIELSSNRSVTWNLVQKLSNKPWDWINLASNPGISWRTLFANLDKFSMKWVSANPNVTADVVKSYKLRWDRDGLSMNSNITADDLVDMGFYIDYTKPENYSIYMESFDGESLRDYESIWRNLSETTTTDMVNKYRDKSWNFDIMSRNPKVVATRVTDYKKEKWDWHSLSENPSIIPEDIDIEDPWIWDDLSQNKAITWEFIQEHPYFPWSYCFMGCNPNITMKIVEDNPEHVWVFFDTNPNITLEFVETRGVCCYSLLSGNLGITLDEILSLDRDWDWAEISKRSDLTFDIVDSNIDLPWDFDAMSQNPM